LIARVAKKVATATTPTIVRIRGKDLKRSVLASAFSMPSISPAAASTLSSADAIAY
jgi:hypothetical protein